MERLSRGDSNTSVSNERVSTKSSNDDRMGRDLGMFDSSHSKPSDLALSQKISCIQKKGRVPSGVRTAFQSTLRDELAKMLSIDSFHSIAT